MPRGDVPPFPRSLPACEAGLSRILGVDPGMGSTGFGIIELAQSGSFQYRESGIIRPRSPLTSHRIQQIFRGLIRLIEEFKPELMAVERPFCGKNVKSAMLLGQARGAAILAAAETGLEVQEYSPLEVKQAVVGYGRAAKEQIQAMVRSLLGHPYRLNSSMPPTLWRWPSAWPTSSRGDLCWPCGKRKGASERKAVAVREKAVIGRKGP